MCTAVVLGRWVLCAARDRRGTINFAGKVCFGTLLHLLCLTYCLKEGFFFVVVVKEKELCI